MSTFDPSTLMSLLQKGAGVSAPDDLNGSNKFANFPSSNNQTPDAPQPQMPPPPQPQSAQPQQAPAQPQQDQRLQGIKGYLSNILHGVGEGMKAHLGMETDAQNQARMFKQNLETQTQQNQQFNTQSEINYRSAQIKDAQQRLTQQQTAADYSRFDFQKDPITGKISVFDKSKAIDLLKQGQDPSGAFTSFDARGKSAGANIDSIDQQILSQAGIDPATLSPQEKAAHAAALFESRLKNDPKPLMDWTNNAANRAVKMAPTVVNGEQVIPVDDPNNPGQTILVKVPKTSTTTKVVPGASASPSSPGQTPSATPRPPVSLSNNNGVKVLNGPDGQPLTKGGGDTVYATNPKTGQQIFTTRTEAAAQGLQTPMKVTAVQARKDQALSNRLADVQRKVGDYADTFSQPIDSQDEKAISFLMQNPLPDNVAHMGSIPLAGFANNLLKSRGIDALTDAGMRRFIQFNQARESLSGYQQILTNSSRSSDKVLELQLEQLPPPLANKDYADMATTEFQKNIDLAGQHTPIFPGSSETQQSIKAEQLARRNARNPQQGQEPPRPANVPAGYKWNPNGPKGAGWYR